MKTTILQFDNYNFDSMDANELWGFGGMMRGVRPISSARKLFPNRPKHYVATAKNLRNYAANKSTAIRCRLRGDIRAALMYEDICERIFAGLPEYARW